ncbi:MAG TPA: hypothetical protein VFO55_06790 [Gemmatimonadaceae bacterium]|nr:hypothetical protein [Gemmatimonadaceae bacterium]
MNRKTQIAIAAGFLGGLMAGAIVWSTQIHRSRQQLFSGRPWRRLAALGYLAGRPGHDTVRLLTDYVRWEQHESLRKRGERLLRRMQLNLD